MLIKEMYFGSGCSIQSWFHLAFHLMENAIRKENYPLRIMIEAIVPGEIVNSIRSTRD